MQVEKRDDKPGDNGAKDKKNWLEWAVFGISLTLVLALLGYLVYHVFTDNPSSPDLQVEAVADPSELSPFRYHITIYNRGGTTAEEVLVELALEKDGAAIETADLHLPFAPQESKREAWVSFSKDPSQADTLVSRVVSYKKP
ncbi:hypothetical protein [Pontibacter sp. H249]|uniref:hypothetical protein n=1 Tax=Pontibacter sp. H249 TaxID=3133420 RepID=UPI0030C55486